MGQSYEPKLAAAIQAHREGKLEEAERLYRSVLARRPEEGLARVNLGVLYGQVGRLDEAVDELRRAVAADPRDPEKLRFLGNALMNAGRVVEAVASFRSLVSFVPGAAMAHRALGHALSSADLPAEAAQSFETAARFEPWNGEIQAEIAATLLRAGRFLEAASAFERAFKSIRGNADASVDYAKALQGAGRSQEASSVLERTVSGAPEHPRALFELARAYYFAKRPDDSLNYYQRAAAAAPEQAVIRFNLAMLLAEEGYTEQARAMYGQVAAMPYGPFVAAAAVREALLAPVIAASREAIEQGRAIMLRRIRELRTQGIVLDDPQAQIGAPGFFLAYQGEDNLTLMTETAALMQDLTRDLVWTAPELGSGGPKIRIGFMSAHLNDHTVGRITAGLIERLDRKTFEVLVLRPVGTADPYADAIDRFADRAIELPSDFRLARQAVAELHLDAIYYPDIGMEPFTYFMAFSRLAPVQCAGWGHADTTGIPNVDYYVSCRHFETPGAEERYSETLVQLDRLNNFYERLGSDYVPMTRSEIGLPDEATLYLCPQSEFKLHPDFDEALAGILETDPQAVIAISSGLHHHWTELLKNRFERTIPNVAARVVSLPRVEPDRFRGLLALADVILDPLHFTGGHTTYLAFSVGAPVVTWNGSHLRGRMTAGLYAMMGVEGPVADDIESYVRLAVELANDNDRREELSGAILTHASRLFEDVKGVEEFERFLISACR